MSSIGGGFGGGKGVNRKLVMRALTDPQFRLQLVANPAAAIGKRQITPQHRLEIQRVLQVIQQVEMQLNRIADELLCADGGPCGIAVF